ncbi:acyl-CoA N-acyltransferase [Mrakia frigida]|uniref:GNAT family N-acetyltransferase n=1 Tax=Mrakia frigida TaxID=29902 RepID=UPI003FCC1736
MSSSPPPRPRPPIEVSPLTRDDFEDLARAQLKAMENDNVYDRIYPVSKRPTEEVRIAHAIQTRTSRPFPFSPSSDSFELKATLPGSSKLIGFAYWVGPTDRTATLGGPTPEEELIAEEEGKKEKSEQQKEKEKTMDLEFHKAFVGEAKRARREIMEGREHWYLGLLFVDPAYQGMGVGSALLNYGISRADAAGLPMYLESSNPGRAVYAAKGFEVVRMMEIDDENEEGGKLRWPAMLRPARALEKQDP